MTLLRFAALLLVSAFFLAILGFGMTALAVFVVGFICFIWAA